MVGSKFLEFNGIFGLFVKLFYNWFEWGYFCWKGEYYCELSDGKGVKCIFFCW